MNGLLLVSVIHVVAKVFFVKIFNCITVIKADIFMMQLFAEVLGTGGQ